jgi:hypothetical protein
MNMEWDNYRYALEFARMLSGEQAYEDFYDDTLHFISKLLVDEHEGLFIENGPKEYDGYNVKGTDCEREKMMMEHLDFHQYVFSMLLANDLNAYLVMLRPDTYWMQAFNFTQEYLFANKMGHVDPEIEAYMIIFARAILMHVRTRDDDVSSLFQISVLL